ncbi:MAG TPA: hypothetical protein VGL92_11460 [Acidimicrobiia bacterium]|jgi:hypothetical protein
MNESVDLPVPGAPHELAAQRRLGALWAGVGVILAGEILDVTWHASHGSFRSGADVVKGHWLGWLGVLLVIAIAARGVRSSHLKSRRGYRSMLFVMAAYVYGSIWNFWGHAGGHDTFLAHVVLTISKIGIVVAAVFITHLVIGRDQNPGFSNVKKKAG